MSEPAAVRVERDGPVTTVLLHRPARRNAVDAAASSTRTATPRWVRAASEALSGAARFSSGAGRHGAFDS